MRPNLICGMVITLCVAATIARADSLELKNGSLIKGRFVGGTDTEIRFQVASSVQRYNIADVVSLKFDSERIASGVPGTREPANDTPMFVTVPAGTRLSVRTIDAIDSTKNHVGIVSRLPLKSH